MVAILGVTAYRQAFGHPKAQLGRQPEPFEGAELWVVPNPSGLNAHETVASLAAAYAEPARAAKSSDRRVEPVETRPSSTFVSHENRWVEQGKQVVEPVETALAGS